MDSWYGLSFTFDVDAPATTFVFPSSPSSSPSFSFGSSLPSAITSVVTTAFATFATFVLKLPIRCPFQCVNRCCFFNLSARLENLCGFIRFLACAPFGPLLCPSPPPVVLLTFLFGFSGATLFASDFRSSCAMSAWFRAIFRFRSNSYSVKFASLSSMMYMMM